MSGSTWLSINKKSPWLSDDNQGEPGTTGESPSFSVSACGRLFIEETDPSDEVAKDELRLSVFRGALFHGQDPVS